MYNKLFSKILQSSVWLESNPTRLVWITCLAAMDEDGMVQVASVRNLAHLARVTDEEAAGAIARLEGPDPDSSNPAHDGRRLERVPGGWIVLNAENYRAIVTRIESLALNRERVRRHRQHQQKAPDTCNASVRGCNGDVTPAHYSNENVMQSESDQIRSEVRTTKVPAAPPKAEAFVALWNELTTKPIPRCLEVTEGRRRAIGKRLIERPLEQWAEVFKAIEASPFCRGENDRGWRATLDWVLRPETATKVLEGKYARADESQEDSPHIPMGCCHEPPCATISDCNWKRVEESKPLEAERG